MSQSQTVLKIEGMSCGMCKGKVEKALKDLSGVTGVTVDLGNKEAVITGSADRAEYVKTVEGLGFKVVG